MNIYTLYIDDDRYRVPTLLSVELPDDEQALAYASALLSKSEHYTRVDIWDAERQVSLPSRLREA